MASAASPSERSRLQRELAERLAESGRKSEAVELLRSMLSEERFDPPFFYNTGNALARLGESDAAVEAYRKAVAQRHGNYSRAQHNLGVVLTRLGRWDEAEEALKAALRSALSDHAQAGTLGLVDASTFDAPSTKAAVALLEQWGKRTPTVIVVAEGEESLAKSFRNLQRVLVTLPSELEVAHVVWARSLLVSQAALDAVERRAAR